MSTEMTLEAAKEYFPHLEFDAEEGPCDHCGRLGPAWVEIVKNVEDPGEVWASLCDMCLIKEAQSRAKLADYDEDHDYD